MRNLEDESSMEEIKEDDHYRIKFVKLYNNEQYEILVSHESILESMLEVLTLVQSGMQSHTDTID